MICLISAVFEYCVGNIVILETNRFVLTVMEQELKFRNLKMINLLK